MKRSPESPATARRDPRGARARELRIIAGQWRGRRLRFPAASPIRPTPDRVRETLFNWLQGCVQGAQCLDLFAGSGALGLEALSRGAAGVVFVDTDAAAVRALRALVEEWHGDGATVLQTDAMGYLGTAAREFDLVFLDPPFAGGLAADACARLAAGGWLAAGARIYLERPRRDPAPKLPATWRELRSGNAGEVSYHLYESGSG